MDRITGISGMDKMILLASLTAQEMCIRDRYYNRPWEITADIYGGVQSRSHTQKDIMAGFAYLEASKEKGVQGLFN